MTTINHDLPPPLHREGLANALAQGRRLKWLHFWGHEPHPSGALTTSCLSQWWAGHPFIVDGITYPTAEHYMMAEKARLFGDEGMRQRILASRHPGEAKKLGRLVAHFSDGIWKAQRWRIIVEGNLAKFSQHEPLRAFLTITTGRYVLVEASPYDRIWGIGLGKEHPDAANPAKWPGLNLLGFALMDVRERLRGLGLPQD